MNGDDWIDLRVGEAHETFEMMRMILKHRRAEIERLRRCVRELEDQLHAVSQHREE